MCQVPQRVVRQAAQRAAVQPEPRQRRAAQRARRDALQRVQRQVPANTSSCHSACTPAPPAPPAPAPSPAHSVRTGRAGRPQAAARRAAAQWCCCLTRLWNKQHTLLFISDAGAGLPPPPHCTYPVRSFESPRNTTRPLDNLHKASSVRCGGSRCCWRKYAVSESPHAIDIHRQAYNYYCVSFSTNVQTIWDVSGH